MKRTIILISLLASQVSIEAKRSSLAKRACPDSSADELSDREIDISGSSDNSDEDDFRFYIRTDRANSDNRSTVTAPENPTINDDTDDAEDYSAFIAMLTALSPDTHDYDEFQSHLDSYDSETGNPLINVTFHYGEDNMEFTPILFALYTQNNNLLDELYPYCSSNDIQQATSDLPAPLDYLDQLEANGEATPEFIASARTTLADIASGS